LALGLVLRDAIGLLDLPRQLDTPSGDDVGLIVGEIAPPCLDLALELLPVACDDVPVHIELPAFRICCPKATGTTGSGLFGGVQTISPGTLVCAFRNGRRHAMTL